MDASTEFDDAYKLTKSVVILAFIMVGIFLTACSEERQQDGGNVKLFGDVRLEYYPEEQIHPQLLEEIKIQKEKYPDPDEFSILYGPDGHLYTTLIVARLAGLDLTRAYLLSYFSQLPDEETAFTAPRGVFYVCPELRRQVVSTLHSLHGGAAEAVRQRQRALQSLVANTIKDNTLKDWQIGIVMHSYADSFAHTYEKDGQLVAYGPWVGHIWHGHKPDTIAFYPDNIENMYSDFSKL